MKVTTEELERCETLLTIEFEPKQEQDLLKKAAKRIARQVRIPGFRPGKAPFNTVVRRFGLEAVQQEALEDLSDKLIKNALEEVGIEPYAQIELVDEISWDPLTLKLKVPTPPKVELGDYRQIRREPDPVEVTDEDVQKRLEELQEANAIWAPVERPAKMGDLVSMTLAEKDGDKPWSKEEAVDYELTPSDQEDENQPDLTTPLLGLSAGDSKTFTVTYPENFENKEYAGKEITVSVEVTGVKEKELDPLDEDFAQMVSEFDTLEELKENIEADIQNHRGRQRDSQLGSEVLEQIIENARKLEWPQALEEKEIDEEVAEANRQLADMSLTVDKYLQMQDKTEEEWREEIRQKVVPRLKRTLALTELAQLEQLEVSQSEILAQAKALADITGRGDQLWQQIMASPTQQNAIASDVLVSKVIHRLAAIAKGEAPELEPEAEEEANAEEATLPPAAEAEPAAEEMAEETGDDRPVTEAEPVENGEELKISRTEE